MMPQPKNRNVLAVSPATSHLLRYWILFTIFIFFIGSTDIPVKNRFFLCAAYAILFLCPLFISPRSGIIRAIPFKKFPATTILLSFSLLIVQYIATDIAARFYTGTPLLEGVLAALKGANTYGEYQKYFSENLIKNTTVLQRAPFVACLAISKLILLYSSINYFLSVAKRKVALSILSTSSIIYIGFGLTRGTFFEVFETLLALGYFWYLSRRSGHTAQSAFGRWATVGQVLVAGMIVLTLFMINISRRFQESSLLFDRCSTNMCYSGWGFSYLVEYPVYVLNTYFGNGPYFISILFEKTLQGLEGAYLLPMQSILFSSTEEFGVRGIMCGIYIDCRFVWTPEIATVLSVLGIGTIFAIPILVKAIDRFECKALKENDRISLMLVYFLFVFEISLPTANFLTISTPSMVAFFALLVAKQIRGGIST